ncbi:MAG: hypothetical protein A3D13_10330 [Planctomycetes bacterium RIFCSPHIGHO2_02_FULL_40_12]|nr:MAG: hypothetical protein A3D13_10330 [Planctomycetes bacterium RIFCSPHIGHO2_02_FULL_40_12]
MNGYVKDVKIPLLSLPSIFPSTLSESILSLSFQSIGDVENVGSSEYILKCGRKKAFYKILPARIGSGGPARIGSGGPARMTRSRPNGVDGRAGGKD